MDNRLTTDMNRYFVYRKFSDLAQARPSMMFVFQDVNPKSICWPYFGVYMSQDSFFNFPASRHQRGAVLTFADGRAEAHKWRDARTVAALSGDYHRHNDSSPGNADILWLRERTTRLR